jgi:hypothetical protein
LSWWTNLFKSYKEDNVSRILRKITPARIVELAATMTPLEIAKVAGLTRVTIYGYLKQAGIKLQAGAPLGNQRGRTHGLHAQGRALGLEPWRFVRLLAVMRLGGKCAHCDVDDLRVLDINHIDGEQRAGKSTAKMREQWLALAKGEKLPYLEVRCCNCNRLHEYERGNFSPIPTAFYDIAKEICNGDDATTTGAAEGPPEQQGGAEDQAPHS